MPPPSLGGFSAFLRTTCHPQAGSGRGFATRPSLGGSGPPSGAFWCRRRGAGVSPSGSAGHTERVSGALRGRGIRACSKAT